MINSLAFDKTKYGQNTIVSQLKENDEQNIISIWKVLSETELKFSSKLTSFRSQTWLLLLVCLGKKIFFRENLPN